MNLHESLKQSHRQDVDALDQFYETATEAANKSLQAQLDSLGKQYKQQRAAINSRYGLPESTDAAPATTPESKPATRT